MAERHIKAEPGMRDSVMHDDTRMQDAKPSYKSWKKKYRKMRLQFDSCMQQCEQLHQEEERTRRMARRLAVENDRMADLLLDMNNDDHIPAESRYDLQLDDDTALLEDDPDEPPPHSKSQSNPAAKSLQHLLRDVPHNSFDEVAARGQQDELLNEIDPEDSEAHPTTWLTTHDVDSYLTELDRRLGRTNTVPIIASSQSNRSMTSSAANFALRNPISVHNWLRRNAPKTFLQDMDKDKDREKDKEKDKDKSHHHEKDHTENRRKSGAARPSAKKASSANRRDTTAGGDWDDDNSVYDHSVHGAGSALGSKAAKRKRSNNENDYHKTNGSSAKNNTSGNFSAASRPAKKRKSDVPTSAKPKKSAKAVH